MTVRSRLLGGLLALAVCASLAVGISSAPAAEAAEARDFNPGNLISDEQFFDGSAMTANEVQNFLNGKVARCQNGFTCLKDFRMNTFTRAAVAGRCDTYQGRNNESAAEIIARVGQACGISQKAMLVLLEKEQGLVTLSNPSASRFTIATGYACPDTAACDAQYFGFYNQVYMAAIQFKRYQGNPTGWNHVAGRTNNIRLHPAASCGSTPVFIQNQATAGLYNYTPYQPNRAALNNLYGTGDSCSSYGNRNFWRMYTDWFGSATGVSSLMRTADNATVYLASGNMKHPINNLPLLENLAPLGQVSFVSQATLDRYTTGQAAGRIMRGEDGSIYYFDSGLRLSFPSCNLVSDYGGSCSATGYVQLNTDQVNRFLPGPLMSTVSGTTSGLRYFVTGGTKREIADAASQATAGIGQTFNVLSDAALDTLALGVPVVQDSSITATRGSSAVDYVYSKKKYPLTDSPESMLGNLGPAMGRLTGASMNMLAAGGSRFSGTVSLDGVTKLLSPDGRYDWTANSPSGSLTGLPATFEFVNRFGALGNIGTEAFIKGRNSDTIGMAKDGVLRPASSWNAFTSIAPPTEPRYLTVPDAIVKQIPVGALLVTPAALFRTPEDATVYLIDGPNVRLPLTSFNQVNAAGINRWGYIDRKSLDTYKEAPAPLSYGITCDAQNYIAAGGRLVPVTDTALFPVPYTAMHYSSCSLMTKAEKPASRFIRTSDGGIYLLEAGTKRPINSMDRFAQLGGNAEGYLQVDDTLAQQIPSGAAA